MRTDLLGLTLEQAQEMLAREGAKPSIQLTSAPKKADRGGKLRVVYASDDGSRLIVSRFVDPLAQAARGE